MSDLINMIRKRMLKPGVSSLDFIKCILDYRAYSLTLNKFRLHICEGLNKEK